MPTTAIQQGPLEMCLQHQTGRYTGALDEQRRCLYPLSSLFSSLISFSFSPSFLLFYFLFMKKTELLVRDAKLPPPYHHFKMTSPDVRDKWRNEYCHQASNN